ncbi:regulator of G-protein signaling domain-containing protein [Aspergillus clavatus NRRL 1]|uniref:RGS domain-containing protein n=1 Tax=Aspergillus clavatus (strain ATCC 1007 / CBS 513.65 / DSM 816 / NCTC 3887 / NRRL 1 / QM 1276 / 107) TaxID=344612 RepID=A1CE76_ASPCL|nr:uncharacterized protein ACLA_088640 [Aspergillus clavatus NRRL 1]EAW11175.1 conserved hypothetical protein [Aspergillus clavatus NRRL 1]
MLKKRSLYPPLFFWNNSPTSTPELSPTSSSSDSESDEDMESSGSRPLSLNAPGAFCPMRPTLDEVLANTAPAPYTLSAFMAYLSQNHCLETLEFTLEAKRYRETYDSLTHRLQESPIVTDCPESQHLRMLWQRLLTAYVIAGAPREINVSSEVREEILRQANAHTPPPPETLDAAVKLVHDLMEESIFIPFLNAHASSAHVLPLSEPLFPNDEDVTVVSHSNLDEHAVKRVRSKGKRLSPKSSRELGSPISSGPPSGHSSRTNFSLNAVTSIGKSSNRSSGPTSSTSGESGSAALTDDSGSSQSAGEPMTPPTTPPSSEPYMPLGHSPKHRTENPWKKMGMKLGFKKRSANGSSGSQHMRFSSMDE